MSGPLDHQLIPEGSEESSGTKAASPFESGCGAVVALAQELIQIDTTNPPGRELPAAEHVAAFLEAAGLEVSVLPFGDERANVVARIRGAGQRASLLLSGHLDTVPIDNAAAWTVPMLGGIVRDGRLYGRGALDMKGAVAAMAVAARNLRRSGRVPKGDVVLAFTAGEETDSCGAQRLCADGLLSDVGTAVIGEPTDLDIGIAHRGALWVRVEARGEAGHGSQPGVGLNAVRELLHWLDPMESIEDLIAEPVDGILRCGSVSLNIIGGGTSANVIPDRAHAVLDFRTVPGCDHSSILENLKSREGLVSLTVLRDSPPIKVSADSALVSAAEAAVEMVTVESPVKRGLPYLTDGSIFVESLGITAIVLGPGAEDGAHTENESVAIDSLEKAAAIYEFIADRLMYQ